MPRKNNDGSEKPQHTFVKFGESNAPANYSTGRGCLGLTLLIGVLVGISVALILLFGVRPV